MKNLLIVFGLLLVACGGGSKTSPSPSPTVAAETGGDGQPQVDPTMPSWMPAACIEYHRAVVQALDCTAIEQGKRDAIKMKYESDNEGWKTSDATPAKVDEAKAYCESATASVRGDIGASCVK